MGMVLLFQIQMEQKSQKSCATQMNTQLKKGGVNEIPVSLGSVHTAHFIPSRLLIE